jgi:hypothetical protein
MFDFWMNVFANLDEDGCILVIWMYELCSLE